MNRRLKQLVAYNLLAAVVATQLACGGAPVDAASSAQEGVSSPTSRPTGEDLFRGILLGQGPVAAKLPELWDSVSYREAIAFAAPQRTTTELASDLEASADTLMRNGLTSEDVAAIRGKAESLRARPLATLTGDDLAAATPEVSDAVIALIAHRAPDFFDAFQLDMESGDPVRVQGAIKRAGEQLVAMQASSEYSPGSTGPDCAAYAIALAVVWWVGAVAAVGIVNTLALVNVAYIFNAVHVSKMSDGAPEAAQTVALITDRFAR